MAFVQFQGFDEPGKGPGQIALVHEFNALGNIEADKELAGLLGVASRLAVRLPQTQIHDRWQNDRGQ